MKIATFKNSYNFTTVSEIDMETSEFFHGYVRTSEWADVDFHPRDPAEQTQVEVALLKAEIEVIKAKATTEIEHRLGRISELLQLPVLPTEAL